MVANVVALDQALVFNRLGATNPGGMIFALERDVVAIDGPTPGPGNAQLRPGKRPLTLRVNVGQKLQINFKNWLSSYERESDQPHTRTASVHVEGMQLVNNIADDGSNVGQNASSLVRPGGSATYNLAAGHPARVHRDDLLVEAVEAGLPSHFAAQTLSPQRHYSYLRATKGSTFVARRAGI